MPCSSFSVTDGNDFFVFLERAFSALAVDVPAAYGALCRSLDGLPVAIVVDGACRVLRASEGSHEFGPELTREITVRLTTSRNTIVEMLEARRSLLEMVLADEFSLVGKIQDLVRLEEGMFAFVHGAARSRRIEGLLTAYLSGTSARPASRGRHEHAR